MTLPIANGLKRSSAATVFNNIFKKASIRFKMLAFFLCGQFIKSSEFIAHAFPFNDEPIENIRVGLRCWMEEHYRAVVGVVDDLFKRLIDGHLPSVIPILVSKAPENAFISRVKRLPKRLRLSSTRMLRLKIRAAYVSYFSRSICRRISPRQHTKPPLYSISISKGQ